MKQRKGRLMCCLAAAVLFFAAGAAGAEQETDLDMDELLGLDVEEIEIEDIDYGIFFVDMQDDPEKYMGKTVHFKGQVLKSQNLSADYFVPARSAMTCCADDIQYIGYICKSKEAPRLKEGSWVDVKATIGREFFAAAGREEPVFTAVSIQPTEAPATELVYFN